MLEDLSDEFLLCASNTNPDSWIDLHPDHREQRNAFVDGKDLRQ